jgi:C1A family cysteine protease
MTVIYRHRFTPDHPRLGRHVAHDARSLGFPADGATEFKTVRHDRLVPIFSQGELGSCTGNAAVGCISTAPFGHMGTEAEAVDVYSQATQLDNAWGTYPPEDTGSSGLAAMKALHKRGLISGYRHGFGLDHTLRALVKRPGIVGMTWLTGCDEPDAHGVVRYVGDVRGGHEVELVGLDVDARLVWFANSWGASWGLGGYFAMGWDDFQSALDDHGDVVFPDVP